MSTRGVLTKCQNRTFGEYMILASVGKIEEDVVELMQQLLKPDYLCGVRVPESLDDMTFGQLIRLQSIGTETEIFLEPCRVLLDASDGQVSKEDAISVLGFGMWVSREMQRINELLVSTQLKPTPEEYQAGIDKLNFGSFGLVDYFSIRMGIADHEDVMSMPWVRIYQCMKIDSEKAKFERRLRKVYENKK